MSARLKGIAITRAEILGAMREFKRKYPDTNSYDDWLDKESYKYAVSYEGYLYPCKRILSDVTGIDVLEFNGGEQSNRVYRALGFEVIDKPGIREWIAEN